ncbi:alpha/beta hydrolase family protein [Sphingobacterium hungaricum]|uniref:S9 family peptidase n=1 Tax=Sphingobacterium hungaricum TaxID=2082723 RepID=A0A928YRR4_9SPHI|nr:S9 family peptidase [Sphingobacterium hungaricum]MBE8714942.1 S9 family peptidase [Sphingobacterium hungaricum]
MKSVKIVSFALLVVGLASCNPSEKAGRTPKEYSSEQLRSNTIISAAGISADDSRVLVSNNVSGIFNVHEITINDTTDNVLTKSTKESNFAIAYLPDGEHFLYASDSGGDENSHIYLASKTDTSVVDITPWPGSSNSFFGWSADKSAIYVLSNQRDKRFFDLWKLNLSDWKPTLIYQNDTGDEPGSLSHNEQFITLTKSITTDKNELYLLDLVSKKKTMISNASESSWIPQSFEKDDSSFYYLTNDSSDFRYLVKYSIATAEREKIYETKWDVDGFYLSKNGKYHTLFINEDGKNKVLLYDHATNKPIDFPQIEDGDVMNLVYSDSEKNILLTVGSSTSPSNLYVYNTDTKDLKQLTNTLNSQIDENDLVKAEVIRFKSFDGKEIPAIYYKPLIADKNHKVPALVYAHGGPGGQSRVGFNTSIQFLVNHGYAVLLVNNRGSSGYGKEFYKMDNKDHGNGDLKDFIWGKKWLQEQNYIDSTEIGIMGGSYGGNIVLNALTLHPDEFKVGVNMFGVANWLRTLKSIPPYWESFRLALYEELGDPYSADSVRLKMISPLFNYEKITKPLIVFQGANDVRVLQAESDEIVAGVKKNGVPVEYVLFPDEGHGFIKKENQIETDNKTLAFLEQYLKVKSKK